VSLDRRGIGTHWEDRAAAYLEARGLTIIERGYRCRLGEIDIIAHDVETLVFVEVRFRRSRRFGSACETVGRSKQAKLIRAARHFLMRYPRYADAPIRFDVIAVDGDEVDDAEVNWLQDAFGGA
jgi:putative endonuclease